MDCSVVMTVHNREPEVLLGTLRSLHRGPMRHAQIIVVNDRSSMDYGWVREYSQSRFDRFSWVSTGDYHGFRLEGGYGNPAKAFNVGVAAASGSRLVLMSSDTLAGPTVQNASPLSGPPWTPRVVDLDSGAEYCGPSRFFPMPWFLSVKKDDVLAVGGWDEQYLDGMCYEDNDLLGRLGCYCKVLLADWSVTAWHQSHKQPAYDAENPEVIEANKRNAALTLKKWGGIPFDGERTPFDVRSRPHQSGIASLTFSMDKTKLDSVITQTKGLR